MDELIIEQARELIARLGKKQDDLDTLRELRDKINEILGEQEHVCWVPYRPVWQEYPYWANSVVSDGTYTVSTVSQSIA